MTKILYSSETIGCGATFKLDSQETCLVSVAQSGVLVKSCRGRFGRLLIGSFGSVLYNVHKAATTAMALNSLYPEKLIPITFRNPVLGAFANAIWQCSTAAEVSGVLNTAVDKVTASENAQTGERREAPYRNASVSTVEPETIARYRKAAEQGDAKAQFLLGEAYHDGDGVTENDTEAVKWWRKAADQGHGGAQHQLGLAYYSGEAVRKEFVLAYMWFNLSATAAYTEVANVFFSPAADEIRDDLEKELTPAEIAEGQRLTREWVEKHKRT
jgi:TPR repeat protein